MYASITAHAYRVTNTCGQLMDCMLIFAIASFNAHHSHKSPEIRRNQRGKTSFCCHYIGLSGYVLVRGHKKSMPAPKGNATQHITHAFYYCVSMGYDNSKHADNQAKRPIPIQEIVTPPPRPPPP